MDSRFLVFNYLLMTIAQAEFYSAQQCMMELLSMPGSGSAELGDHYLTQVVSHTTTK